MPRPNDSPDVAASKTLAYLLRHGAEKESLHMRSDGYIKLSDVLARPKMRGIDVEMVLRLVAENAKQRFELFYGYDPSPPAPKAKKGEGKRKKGPNPFKGDGTGSQGTKGERIEPNETADSGGTAPTDSQVGGTGRSGHDAATLDDLQHDLAKSKLDTPVELPLVSLPVPDARDAKPSATSSSSVSVDSELGTGSKEVEPPNGVTTPPTGEYFIRATQGHSLKVNHELHLEPVQNDDEGRRKVGEMVHGTKWEVYDAIKSSGLSRMSRQHVHLAPALSDHPILPRNGSSLLIYLDLEKLLAAGVPVYVASNGVVLTPGNEEGKVPMELWRKVERVEKGQRRVVWQNGKDVEPPYSDSS